MSLSAALNEWDDERSDRHDSGEAPGPSRSTALRWVKEFGNEASFYGSSTPNIGATRSSPTKSATDIATLFLKHGLSAFVLIIFTVIAPLPGWFFDELQRHRNAGLEADTASVMLCVDPILEYTLSPYKCFPLSPLPRPP